MAERNRKVKICIITTVGLSLDKLFPDFYPILTEKGYEIVGICAEDKYTENVRRQRVRVITVPMTRDFTPIQDLRCFWKLYKIFRHEKFDLINYSTTKASLLAAIAGRLAGNSFLLYTLRGLGYTAYSGAKRLVSRWCEKIACLAAHRVIAISKSLAAEAVRENLLPKNRIEVLGAGSSKGVNLEEFNLNEMTRREAKKIRQKLNIADNIIVIGYAGRLTEEKGIRELLRAFLNLNQKHSNLHLLIIGDNDQRNPLPVDILSLINREACIHKIASTNNLMYYIAAMDIFVLVSYREGFGNVLIEASAMERPVIASNIIGCRDAVLDVQTGILVKPRDVLSLERALRDLIENPSKRIEMGRNGKQWVTKNFDRKVVWNRLVKVYEQMLY